MCNCNEEINKKCPNRVCAYCDWHLELQAKEQKLEKIKEYCLKNKASAWCDVEGIIGIIEGKENE